MSGIVRLCYSFIVYSYCSNSKKAAVFFSELHLHGRVDSIPSSRAFWRFFLVTSSVQHPAETQGPAGPVAAGGWQVMHMCTVPRSLRAWDPVKTLELWHGKKEMKQMKP